MSKRTITFLVPVFLSVVLCRHEEPVWRHRRKILGEVAIPTEPGGIRP
jgi:hypothetical protein